MEVVAGGRWWWLDETHQEEKVKNLRFTFGFCDSQTKSAIHNPKICDS